MLRAYSYIYTLFDIVGLPYTASNLLHRRCYNLIDGCSGGVSYVVKTPVVGAMVVSSVVSGAAVT